MDGAPTGNNADVFAGRDTTRVPLKVYEDPGIYQTELRKIFYGPTWNYVGLECEVPDVGDFRRNFIGEREILMIRKEDGGISVVENRCAHRGAQLCQALDGNTGGAIMCPYHQWTFSLDGDLTGVPFRRGYKGQGGYPKDFDMSQHGLTQLKVEILNGVVFASFDHATPPLAEDFGDHMITYFTRVFDGRPLRVVGYQRQIIDSNWKLQMENLKDPYHAGILHLFLINFGLFRLDQKSAYFFDDAKGHTVLMTERGTEDDEGEYGGVKVAAPDFSLTDHELVQPRKEFCDDVTLAIQTLFPSIIVQAQSNTLATRHIIPKGPGSHELVWTFFGFEDDDEEMRTLRLRQANLMGSAGYVTLDDAEALEFSQIGVGAAPDGAAAVLELDGKDAQSGDCLVTEALIRGFFMRYRDIMGFEKAAP
jgi:phenylpropionate dioxygenase-like ring-hydroxylating dioxygenase large terminal subunit